MKSKLTSLFVICMLLLNMNGCVFLDENNEPTHDTEVTYECKEDLPCSMKDGLTDPVISKIYAEDISEEKNIKIHYSDCDLNDDGITDKIVTLCSYIHSDWRGDTVELLSGKPDGTYDEIGSIFMPVYSAGRVIADIYILDDKTGEWHDIQVKRSGIDDIYLQKYDDNRYNRVANEKEVSERIATPISTNSIDGITQDEAIELCLKVFGKTDGATGYGYEFFPNGAAEFDGKKYYVITFSRLIDNSYYSRMGELMVASDGSVIYDGYIDSNNNCIFADVHWQK